MAACRTSLLPLRAADRNPALSEAGDLRKVLELLRGRRRIVIMRRLPTGPTLTCHGRRRDHEKGAAMSGTQRRRALARYRDAVAERIECGEPFGEVENSIDQVPDLSTDEKAALWLFAFSLRDPVEQQLAARSHLASLH
jgi:hypothetical protein